MHDPLQIVALVELHELALPVGADAKQRHDANDDAHLHGKYPPLFRRKPGGEAGEEAGPGKWALWRREARNIGGFGEIRKWGRRLRNQRHFPRGRFNVSRLTSAL